jgi:hypothetical protein
MRASHRPYSGECGYEQNLEEETMHHPGWALGAFLLCATAVSAVASGADELLPPVQIRAGGKALDIEREGHAAPFVGDFFGDGSLCLLVGQFHDGRLRVYRNTGTRARPRFDSYTWFEAGGKVASVPVG